MPWLSVSKNETNTTTVTAQKPTKRTTKCKIQYKRWGLSRVAYYIRYLHMWYEDMISSLLKISMISLISSLSLKLYLNSLVHHRNIFGSSSKVFSNFRKSSDIFGNLRKFSKNVRQRSFGLRNNFGKSSEIFGKWSEIFGKSSKMPSSVCLYNKKNITR